MAKERVARLEFEDNGQDFTWWEVDVETQKVIACGPWQFSVWVGIDVVNIQSLVDGDEFKPDFMRDARQGVWTMRHRVVEARLIKDEETAVYQYGQHDGADGGPISGRFTGNAAELYLKGYRDAGGDPERAALSA